jgi:hypothetical protein
VLSVIIVVVILLLVPNPKWASDGHIRVPVRVLVFDALHGKRIAHARITLFRAPTLVSAGDFDEYADQYQLNGVSQVSEEHQSLTNADGTAVITFDFRTGASHLRPTPHAHLAGA